jgi:co-chaperonin GroES (HSP10)
MKSKYLRFFQKLKEQRPNFYQLYGSRILVEVLPDPEVKTAGGLIVSGVRNQVTDTQENKFTAAVILAVGAGYYNDETNEDVPLTLKPGQVVEVVRTALRRYSTHPALGSQFTTGDLATTKEADINGLLADTVEEYAVTLGTIIELQGIIG